MFARIMCPACQHKFTIPEGDMGKRQVCPNCQSPFLAGKSVPEAQEPEVAMKFQPAADAGYAKTMLGETAPPIKFTCPRCKKPLEEPASEAGVKKPCPSCGQRIQVPAAPPPPAAAPQLNKTMLAETQPPIKYNCPNCKKPLESPASEAGTKKPCPFCGQRLQVPAGAPQPNLSKTMLASDESGQAASVGAPPTGTVAGAVAPAPPKMPVPPKVFAIVGIGAGVLVLLLLAGCVIPSVIRGGKAEDSEALAQELKKLRSQIDSDKLQMEKQKQFEAEQRQALEKMLTEQKSREKRNEEQWQLVLQNEKYRDNKELMAKAKADYDEKQRELNEKALELERKRQKDDADNKARLDDLARKLAEAQRSQQTIIQQPPVIYYPPYHPGYYRPWWW
jgi:DNA-directed RNA polymerase subunit RPC12/RpoP